MLQETDGIYRRDPGIYQVSAGICREPPFLQISIIFVIFFLIFMFFALKVLRVVVFFTVS